VCNCLKVAPYFRACSMATATGHVPSCKHEQPSWMWQMTEYLSVLKRLHHVHVCEHVSTGTRRSSTALTDSCCCAVLLLCRACQQQYEKRSAWQPSGQSLCDTVSKDQTDISCKSQCRQVSVHVQVLTAVFLASSITCSACLHCATAGAVCTAVLAQLQVNSAV
jgi:hypothetical protein